MPCKCTHENHSHDYCTGNNCTFPPPQRAHWHSDLVLTSLGEFENKLQMNYHCRECGRDFKFETEKL
jgi:hypothetical protein